jgi:hypothetical protein
MIIVNFFVAPLTDDGLSAQDEIGLNALRSDVHSLRELVEKALTHVQPQEHPDDLVGVALHKYSESLHSRVSATR